MTLVQPLGEVPIWESSSRITADVKPRKPRKKKTTKLLVNPHDRADSSFFTPEVMHRPGRLANGHLSRYGGERITFVSPNFRWEAFGVLDCKTGVYYRDTHLLPTPGAATEPAISAEWAPADDVLDDAERHAHKRPRRRKGKKGSGKKDSQNDESKKENTDSKKKSSRKGSKKKGSGKGKKRSRKGASGDGPNPDSVLSGVTHSPPTKHEGGLLGVDETELPVHMRSSAFAPVPHGALKLSDRPSAFSRLRPTDAPARPLWGEGGDEMASQAPLARHVTDPNLPRAAPAPPLAMTPSRWSTGADLGAVTSRLADLNFGGGRVIHAGFSDPTLPVVSVLDMSAQGLNDSDVRHSPHPAIVVHSPSGNDLGDSPDVPGEGAADTDSSDGGAIEQWEAPGGADGEVHTPQPRRTPRRTPRKKASPQGPLGGLAAAMTSTFSVRKPTMFAPPAPRPKYDAEAAIFGEMDELDFEHGSALTGAHIVQQERPQRGPIDNRGRTRGSLVAPRQPQQPRSPRPPPTPRRRPATAGAPTQPPPPERQPSPRPRPQSAEAPVVPADAGPQVGPNGEIIVNESGVLHNRRQLVSKGARWLSEKKAKLRHAVHELVGLDRVAAGHKDILNEVLAREERWRGTVHQAEKPPTLYDAFARPTHSMPWEVRTATPNPPRLEPPVAGQLKLTKDKSGTGSRWNMLRPAVVHRTRSWRTDKGQNIPVHEHSSLSLSTKAMGGGAGGEHRGIQRAKSPSSPHSSDGQRKSREGSSPSGSDHGQGSNSGGLDESKNSELFARASLGVDAMPRGRVARHRSTMEMRSAQTGPSRGLGLLGAALAESTDSTKGETSRLDSSLSPGVMLVKGRSSSAINTAAQTARGDTLAQPFAIVKKGSGGSLPTLMPWEVSRSGAHSPGSPPSPVLATMDFTGSPKVAPIPLQASPPQARKSSPPLLAMTPSLTALLPLSPRPTPTAAAKPLLMRPHVELLPDLSPLIEPRAPPPTDIPVRTVHFAERSEGDLHGDRTVADALNVDSAVVRRGGRVVSSSVGSTGRAVKKILKKGVRMRRASLRPL